MLNGNKNADAKVVVEIWVHQNQRLIQGLTKKLNMKNTDVILSTLASVCLLWSCNSDKEVIRTVNGKKPNIIFILTDDQRWDALGYAGNQIIHTPNMDKLAKEGLYFENAFVTCKDS